MASGSAKPSRLRVPRDDGAVLAVPPLAEATSLVEENRRLFQRHADRLIAGTPFDQLRRAARQQLLAEAVATTRKLAGDVDRVVDPDWPIVATGHQPAPFHPGVWIKNFATDGLANRVGGVGLNVVVDGDLRSSGTVRIAAGLVERPNYETVAFDVGQPVGPWEEAAPVDRDSWESFPARLRDGMSSWNVDPCITSFWNAEPGPDQAAALSRIRVAAERGWGARNLELFQSRVCRTTAFLRFVLDVVRRVEEFRDVHNRVLADYRRANRIRSTTHPVPALTRHDGWTEAPFWVWRAGESQRRPLLVDTLGSGIGLQLPGDEVLDLPHDDEAAVGVLRDLDDRGIRLRTRALTTTMFLRTFVCDLFVHGVGGAKYDEMTDRLIEEFLGLPAPRFLLLSGTKLLPFADEVPPVEQLRERHAELRRRLRDLRFNAERHLDSHEQDESFRALVAEKRDLVERQHEAERERERPLSRRERQARSPANRHRFERLQEIGRRLASAAESRRNEVALQLASVERQLAAAAVLRSREWSWWLHDEESLRAFLTGLNFA